MRQIASLMHFGLMSNVETGPRRFHYQTELSPQTPSRKGLFLFNVGAVRRCSLGTDYGTGFAS